MRDPDARYRVLVADKVSPSGLATLTGDPRFEVIHIDGLDEDGVREALARADALIVRSATQVNREMMDEAPRLKAVGRAGVGVDNIDLRAATERGIPVMNAPAGNTVSAAEMTMALLLATARKVVEADRSVRRGEWKRSALKGSELRGKTLGLVGAGRIGGEVARRAQAFGMDVVVFDPYLTEDRAAEMGVERTSVEEVLRNSDFVTLHVPLTSATRGMLGAEQIALMKPSAVLINAARGGVVVEEALVDALKEGRLRGAALDVYEAEPLAEDSVLREAPNLVLTPHLGASTKENMLRIGDVVVRILEDFVQHTA
jgi:D-3-phosphoglycerate dehydrogenase